MSFVFKRNCAALAALLVTVVAPAAASARVIELGAFDKRPKPACPGANCFAVSRTTGYQGKVDGDHNVMQAPKDGRIVAWTIYLSKPSKKQIDFFETTLGGEPSAGITVFEPGKKYAHTIVASSPIMRLTDYLGERVQFPLERSIPIEKGQWVALTVPTWAPALEISQPGGTSWRASRAKGSCNDTTTQTAQTSVGRTTTFGCQYRTARLTYSVLMLTTPPGPPTTKK